MIADLYLNENSRIVNEIEEPFEFITQAIYESELNMERIEKAMMLEEYHYLLENGQEMSLVSEGAIDTIKEFFRKIKDAILSFFRKIKDFFKSLFSKTKTETKKTTAVLAKIDKIGKPAVMKKVDNLYKSKDLPDVIRTSGYKYKMTFKQMYDAVDQWLTNGDSMLSGLLKYQDRYDQVDTSIDPKKHFISKLIPGSNGDQSVMMVEIDKKFREPTNHLVITQEDINDLRNYETVMKNFLSDGKRLESTIKEFERDVNKLEQDALSPSSDAKWIQGCQYITRYLYNAGIVLASIHKKSMSVAMQKAEQTRMVVNRALDYQMSA